MGHLVGGRAGARWVFIVSGVAPLAEPAFAGAWTQAPGEQQWIASVSHETSDFGEAWRADDLTEFGFKGGWAVNFKVESQMRIGDALDNRSGFRAGVQKSFALGERGSFSVQASVLGGESLDGPDCEGEGYETRAALGTSFALAGHESFVNVETAAKSREDGCNRQLIEITTGAEITPNLKVMVKAWSEDGAYAHSEKVESALLYSFGELSVGLGWRQEISGRFEEKGWVVQAWRKF